MKYFIIDVDFLQLKRLEEKQMYDLKVTEYHGIRVLTSAQVAQMYETDTKTISYNFSYNKQKYTEGKHYIKLEGIELKEFKASREIPDCHKFSAHLYLWTEKGALLHAKSLNTDKAWQAYDYLVDFYFRAKEKEPEIQEKKEPEKRVSRKIDISSEAGILKAIQKIRRDITCMDVLLEKCEKETWESKYIDTKFEAMDMVRLIAEDCNELSQLQPKVIQEISY